METLSGRSHIIEVYQISLMHRRSPGRGRLCSNPTDVTSSQKANRTRWNHLEEGNASLWDYPVQQEREEKRSSVLDDDCMYKKYKGMWLRGPDLNQRPLGYEPYKPMARLCFSMTYVHVVLRFSTLFCLILFSICSSIVLQFVLRVLPPSDLRRMLARHSLRIECERGFPCT